MNTNQPKLQSENQVSTTQPDGVAAETIKSSQLFRNSKELVIEHGNEIYRLRITKQDKLILTK